MNFTWVYVWAGRCMGESFVILMLCKSSQNAFLANFNHSYNSHIFLFIVTISYDVLKVVFNILERSSIF